MTHGRFSRHLWLFLGVVILAGQFAPGAAEVHEDSATRCVESLRGTCIDFNACGGSVVGVCHGGQVCCRATAPSEPGGGGALEPPSNGTAAAAAAGPGDLFYRALPLYDLGCRSDGVYAQLGTLHWFERALELGGRRRLLAAAALDVRGSLFDCALFKRVHAEDADYAWPLANFSLAASPQARYALAAADVGGGRLDDSAPAGDGEGAAWAAGGAWQGALRHGEVEPAWQQYGTARGRLALYAQNEAAAAGRPGERLLGLLAVKLDGAWHLASTGHARVASSCGEQGAAAAAPNASLLTLEPESSALPRNQWCEAAPDLRFVADARPLAQQVEEEEEKPHTAADEGAHSSVSIMRYSVPEQSPFTCLAADSPEALARLIADGVQGPNGLCLSAHQCAHTGGILGPYVQGGLRCTATLGHVAGCCVFGPMGGVDAPQPVPEPTPNTSNAEQQAPEPAPVGSPQSGVDGSTSPDTPAGPETRSDGNGSPHASNASQHVRGTSTRQSRGLFIGLAIGFIAPLPVAILVLYGRRWVMRRRERPECLEESWHLMTPLSDQTNPSDAARCASSDGDANAVESGVHLEELSLSSVGSHDEQNSEASSEECGQTADPIARIYNVNAPVMRKSHFD